mmetsp:Transcript_117783/g.333880  ORF Transcript_117783/g.333880 Transcript_117783/m.333880 type:complete len:369 (-) Transcript_117783:194-1300(-)
MGAGPCTLAVPMRPYAGCAGDPPWRIATVFDVYEFDGLLGSGTFGQVRLCWRKSDPEKQHYAMKIVDLKGEALRQASAFVSAHQEASILKSLPSHPHIVEFADVFETPRWLYLVMECVAGGELFSALADPKVIVNESGVATVGSQLLQALRHLHDRNIVHRDVKAENILLASHPARSGKWHIKLIDFGLAIRLETQPCLFKMCQEAPLEELICGTAAYCAPEVWANDYGPKVDVWAAGVLLYLALLGVFPFNHKDPCALEAMICNPDRVPSFQPVCAKECPAYRVSPPAHNCLSKLLEKDKDTRPCAAAALATTESWLHDLDTPVSLPQIGAAGRNHQRIGVEGDRVVPLAVRTKTHVPHALPPLGGA